MPPFFPPDFAAEGITTDHIIAQVLSEVPKDAAVNA